MGITANLKCFCLETISPRDPPSSTSSEWSALTSCGHIYHTACLTEWRRQQPAGSTLCPSRCPELSVSLKDALGRRKPHRTVRLWFEKDVHSDGLDSQALPPPTSDGIDIMSLGKRFGILSEERGGARRREEMRAGDEEEEEEEIEEDATEESDLIRLRRERNEATAAARDARALRDKVEELEEKVEALEADLQDANETRAELESELDEREKEVEQLSLNQPDLRAEVRTLKDRIEVLEAGEVQWGDAVEAEKENVREVERKLAEERNDRQTETIELKQKIWQLEGKLKHTGTKGEQVVAKLKATISEQEDLIMRVRSEKDLLDLTTKKELKKVRATAETDLATARHKEEEATRAKNNAETNATQVREELLKMQSGLRSRDILHQKLKDKYKKLKLQRGKAISDDEEDDSDRSPARRAPPPAVQVVHSSPEDKPFRINRNTASTSTLSSGTKRRHDDEDDEGVIDLCESEDELEPAPTMKEEEEDDDDDLYAFPRPAASSAPLPSRAGKTTRVFSANGGGGASPSKRSVPMPTLSERNSNRSWGPVKTELSKQKSDKYLPDFASGKQTDHGVKKKIKRRA